MKRNKKTANQRRFEKNRRAKIERNKKKRITATRAMRIAMAEEEKEQHGGKR